MQCCGIVVCTIVVMESIEQLIIFTRKTRAVGDIVVAVAAERSAVAIASAAAAAAAVAVVYYSGNFSVLTLLVGEHTLIYIFCL
jgi:hypothetical protein